MYAFEISMESEYFNNTLYMSFDSATFFPCPTPKIKN